VNAFVLSVILPLAGVGRYQYKEIKVTDTMYELPIPYVSYWDDAVAEFGRRHAQDDEIVTIVRPDAHDWDKKVVITVKKKQK
jgi:hypothetical protein